MKKATPFPTKRRKQPRIAWVIASTGILAATSGCGTNYYANNANNAPANGYATASQHYGTTTTNEYVTASAYDPTNSQRDPRVATNTIADCVHGSTGTAANMDCSRNHASRHTMDTSARHTDTAYANGSMHEYDVAWSSPNPAYVYDYRQEEVPYAYNYTNGGPSYGYTSGYTR